MVPHKKLIRSVLIAIAALLVFSLAMALLEIDFSNDKLKEDHASKIISIRETMLGYDTQANKVKTIFADKLNTDVRMMALILSDYLDAGKDAYTGPDVFEDGFVVRLAKDGAKFPPSIRESFPDYTAEEIRQEHRQFSHANTSLPSESRDTLLTSSRIGGNWYYVHMTSEQLFENGVRSQIDQDRLLQTVSEGYEGEIFIVSSAEAEGGILYATRDFASYQALDNLGLSQDDLSKGEFSLSLENGRRYLCFPVRMPAMHVTAVFCEPLGEMTASIINRVLSLVLFAGILFAVLITWLTALERFPSVGAPDEKHAERYAPGRVRRVTFALGFSSMLLVFLFAFFTRSLHYMHIENEAGLNLLSILETQMAAEEEKYAVREKLETEWYTYCGQRFASLAEAYPTLLQDRNLAALSDAIGADYIMVFDSGGNEFACSGDYTGYSLGVGDPGAGDEADASADFRRLLHGEKLIIHEPAEDRFSRLVRQIMGIRITLPEEQGKYGAMLIAVEPDAPYEEDRQNIMQRILGQIVTEDDLMLEIDPETGLILSSNIKDLVGTDAVSAGISKNRILENYMCFFRLDGTLYHGISHGANGNILYFAERAKEMVQTALLFSLAACVLFGLGYFILACTMLKGAGSAPVAEAVREPELKPGGTPSSGDGYPLWRAELSAMWQKLLPEKKAEFVFRAASGLLMVDLLLAASGRGVFSQNAVLSFIFSTDWPRGFNIFAVTSIIMMLCIGILLYLLMKAFFQLLYIMLDTKGKTVSRLVQNLLEYILAAAMIFYSLSFLGVDTTTLLASLGLVSLALTLGSKDIMSDILSGMSIIFEGDYQVGDIVEINGYRGTVLEIGVRSTRLLGDDANVRIISNHNVSDVLNLTKYNSWYNFTANIPVTYSPEELENMLKEELPKLRKGIPEIISGPIYKGITSISHGYMTISIMAEYQEKDYYKVQRKLNHAIRKLFEKAGIPFI